MTLKYILLSAISLISFTHLPAQPQIELQPFASGLNTPIGLTSAGDSRLFVVEQRGLIRILADDGTVLETPFLDLSGTVSQSGSETGLLGLAFHPDYESNGFFFVNYTHSSDGHTVVARYQRDATNPDMAEAESETVLFTVAQPAENHNGGQLLFGPDGYLYIFLGDGGGGGDQDNNAQNPASYLGKLLRIDVDVNEPPYYLVPPDNPFVNNASVLDEIWTLGLRNPWRSSFDRLTGDLWIADVGQAAREEINFQSATSPGGENYGWRCYEGNLEYNQTNCNEKNNYTFPVFDYAHQGDRCSGSVTGGYVYRGALYNGMAGHYLFADYCTGIFYHVWPTETGFDAEDLGTFDRFQYTSFAENQYGELFVVLKGQGEVQKIVETGDCKPVAQIKEMNFPVEIGSGENIALEALYHPSLQYQWSKEGTSLPNETTHTLHVSVEGTYSVTVTNPANACSNTSVAMEVSFVPVSVALPEAGKKKVYPNPAGPFLYIEGLPATGQTTISLIDGKGVTVITQRVNNTISYTLPTKSLPDGLYMLRIKHGSRTTMKKVVIRIY